MNTIAELVCQQLAAGPARDVEGHVADCPACRQLVAALAGSSLVREPASAAPTPELGRPRGHLRPKGTVVDRYVLIECLGAGGMGVVYAAYDPELDRRIALKLVRAELGPARARELLLAEAQAMARLAHPNVIAVHDVGTHEDEVFIAMELAEGGTLRDWLRSPRSVAAVVAVLEEAGRGLVAAHAAGLVHRDFKPENVLIGSDGRPRVSDFGIAVPTAAVSQELAGTLAYMAPEQHAGGAADPRSDQYSYCVVVQEALPGARMPRPLRRAIGRGMRADPAERHPSMAALLGGLVRGRRIRRGALAAAVAAVAVAGVMVGTRQLAADDADPCTGGDAQLATVWNADRAAQVRAAFAATGLPYAEATAATVAGGLDRWRGAWIDVRRQTCEATARNEQSSDLLDLRMQCLRGRASTIDALVDVFAHADAQVVERAIAALEASTALASCDDPRSLLEPMRAPGDPGARDRFDPARSRLAEAEALRSAGRLPAAALIAEEVVTAADALPHRPLAAEARLLLGMLRAADAELDDASTLLAQARRDADASGHDRVRAEATLQQIQLLSARSRFDDADRAIDDAVAMIERLESPPDLSAELSFTTGGVASARGEYALALERYREALRLREQIDGADSLASARIRREIAQTLGWLSRWDEADAALGEALAIAEARLGAGHPTVADMLHTRAINYTNLVRSAEARDLFERALAIYQAALGPDHVKVGRVHADLSVALLDLKLADEARVAVDRAVAILEGQLGPDHVDVARVIAYRGDYFAMTEHDVEAVAEFDRAISIVERANGKDHPLIADLLGRRATSYRYLERFDDALADLARAHQIRLAALGPDDPSLLYDVLGAALVYAKAGRSREAIPSLDQALADAIRLGVPPIMVAEVQLALGDALLASDRKRARELLTAAHAFFVASGDPSRDHAARAAALLAR